MGKGCLGACWISFSPSLRHSLGVSRYSQTRHSYLRGVLRNCTPLRDEAYINPGARTVQEVLALPGEPLGGYPVCVTHIKLKPNTNPVYINAYKLPQSQRAVVQQLISEMLQQCVIKESNSQWNSQLFLVPNKECSVIHFRCINDATVDGHFPLPVLRDLLMCLGRGNKVFTSLDLVSGYWLPSTPHGHYEWTRMPFGLRGAPLTFQRTMNNILRGLADNSVYVYLDDIIIASKDVHAHMATLKAVLHRHQ